MEHPTFPYSEGNILRLNSTSEGSIECKIVGFFRPATLSCVMEVEIVTASFQSTRSVLKLYDPRHSTQLRDDLMAPSFGLAQEIAYSNFVKSGEAQEFRTKFFQDDDFGGLREGKFSEAQREVFLHCVCIRTFENECKAYDRLKDLQGRDIPRLITEVKLPTSSSSAEEAGEKFFEVKGLLLELVEGFTLHKLPYQAPRKDWQKICNQALQVIQKCNEQEILNTDVQPSNFIICPLLMPSSENNNNTSYRVVMLDFGQCRTRRPDESDGEWGHAKWTECEESRIGWRMQRKLKKFGFDLVYEPYGRYEQWAFAG